MRSRASVDLTRREFVVASGATLAACALGTGWSVPSDAAVVPMSAPDFGPGMGRSLRGDGNVERMTTHVDGLWRVVGWQRRGEPEAVELAPLAGSPEAFLPVIDPVATGCVRLRSPLRGVEEVSYAAFLGGAAHDVVRREFGGSVLEEVLLEVRRRVAS